ncbi:MAG: 8-oxo-dGTP pyrophosphatase MutT (NUDIX family) [Gammaproteobacteria bacterium]|jgi:8-oxo-dGTP pyrophosphatase MutT (NUDIX family)
MPVNEINEMEHPSAAVALIVTHKSPSILLVRRADNAADPWSGQWAFPGGKVDESDFNLLATCQREVLEECGCQLSTDHYERALPISKAGRQQKHPVIVAPFLWEIPERVALTPDETEIAAACWLELSYLTDPINHDSGVIASEYDDREFPYIRLGDTPLWGFTYMVLMNYLNERENN